LNIGTVVGGREVYTTPDQCLVRFSVRYSPNRRGPVLDRIYAGVADLARESPRGFEPRIVGFADYDAAETSVDDGLARRFVEIARSVHPVTKLSTLVGTCDARHFRNLAGIPTLVYGPGRLSDAHAPNEHVEVGDLLEAATVLATFVAAQAAASD
jgi:acetylornithine deacetylase